MSCKEQQLLGFLWSRALVERSRRSVGATLAAASAGLDAGVAVSLAGGTHHADHAAGAGFCVFNDVAVAALSLVRAQHVQRALIVDCDVHQGDGTARILTREPNIFTLSAHSARNYPHDKAISEIDVALPDGTADDAYLWALQTGIERAFARATGSGDLYRRCRRLPRRSLGPAGLDESRLNGARSPGTGLRRAPPCRDSGRHGRRLRARARRHRGRALQHRMRRRGSVLAACALGDTTCALSPSAT